MSSPRALLLQGQMPMSYLAREPFAIPTPATAASPMPNLNIGQSCCCVRVRGVCFFLVLLYRPGEARAPE